MKLMPSWPVVPVEVMSRAGQEQGKAAARGGAGRRSRRRGRRWSILCKAAGLRLKCTVFTCTLGSAQLIPGYLS